jgi:DNA transformation protein
MSVSDEYKTFVEELFAGLGPVSIRRMFGGAGVFHDGVMVAIIAGDCLYLKADATTRGEFEAEGTEPFSYEAKGRTITLSYWGVPEWLYDDPEAFAGWARKAFAVAYGAKKGGEGKATAR